MAGLQLIWAMRSRFMVMSAVLRPIRAAAMAASHPACPAPTTTTSYCSVKAIRFYFTGREMVARRRVRARTPARQPVRRPAVRSGSVDDLVGAGFEIGWIRIRRGWEIGVNADANRHARSEVVDVNIGDEQGGATADQIMTAALVDKPEGNGPVRLSDFEGKGLARSLPACRSEEHTAELQS